MGGGEGERSASSLSSRGEKAEFSIAQYEFSPACGMQESIYAFY
jgi:hypothetical protein